MLLSTFRFFFWNYLQFISEVVQTLVVFIDRHKLFQFESFGCLLLTTVRQSFADRFLFRFKLLCFDFSCNLIYLFVWTAQQLFKHRTVSGINLLMPRENTVILWVFLCTTFGQTFYILYCLTFGEKFVRHYCMQVIHIRSSTSYHPANIKNGDFWQWCGADFWEIYFSNWIHFRIDWTSSIIVDRTNSINFHKIIPN